MIQTLGAGISTAVTQASDVNAFEYKGQWQTWGEVSRFMNELEDLLGAARITAGTPVGVFMRNRPAHLSAALQLLITRRCIVTINPFQSADKLAVEIKNLRCAAYIGDEDDWKSHEVRTAVGESGSVGILANQRPHLSVSFIQGLSDQRSGTFLPEQEGTSVLMLTSGTTGPAKRIKLPYSNLEQAFAAATHYQSNPSKSALRTKTPAVLTSPLAHIGGLYFALDAVMDIRPLVLMEKFNIDDFIRIMQVHQPKMISLPPAALRMILDAEVPVDTLHSLKAIRTGSAPLTPELQDSFEQRYGVPVLNVYGATEFAGAVAGWSLKDHQTYRRSKIGAVGRAQPGVELRVVCAESGVALPPGQTGILEVKTIQVDPNRWIRTTDLGDMDEDGFLYLRGRADDAIIRGGFKVLPREIETTLKQHPAVHDACVIGLADPRLGAIPVAAIVLREGAEASEQELLDFSRTHLVAYQVPVQIRLISELPRTLSMKVSQHEVRNLFL